MARKSKNLWKNNQILRQIVDRCHVGDSHIEVLEYVKTRMKFANLTEESQAQIMTAVAEIHEENRALYSRVMQGF
jgi:predicted nucleic acid-binding OB-fold protein